jgi:hypothetical protein
MTRCSLRRLRSMRRSVTNETRYEAAALQAKESERLEELATRAHDGSH